MIREAHLGYIYAVGAYLIWGNFPLYWAMLGHVNALEVLAHRTFWTFVFVIVLLSWRKLWPPVLRVLKQPKALLLLLLTASLVALNWGVFIWAVTHEHVMEASLGYYLTPLLNVLFGLLFFGEKLRFWQWVSIALAIAGVMVELIALGQLPWIGITLGLSFAAYGGFRKFVDVDSITGLAVESFWLTPIAIGFMVWLAVQESAAFLTIGLSTDLLLAFGGVMTAVPLLLFVASAKRLTMATTGLLFYLNPSLQFICGVFFMGETVSNVDLVTFGCIWVALLIYTYEGFKHRPVVTA